jgi:hypothetical protein
MTVKMVSLGAWHALAGLPVWLLLAAMLLLLLERLMSHGASVLRSWGAPAWWSTNETPSRPMSGHGPVTSPASLKRQPERWRRVRRVRGGLPSEPDTGEDHQRHRGSGRGP